MKIMPSALFNMIKQNLLRSSGPPKVSEVEASPKIYQNSSSSRLIDSMSDEENNKLRQIEQKVFTNQKTTQTRSKMKDLYFERILHDFIMLNPGISVSELFADFEQKPLHISKYLKVLENKGKIIFQSNNNLNYIRAKNSNFDNNLILKKIQSKDEKKFLLLIGKLKEPETVPRFQNNRLTINKDGEVLHQIVIEGWKKI